MATYTTQTRVRKNSGETDVGTRRRVNFIEGANVTLNIVDDGTDGEIDVEIVSAAGGGDVTAAAVMTDHAIVRGDGGAKGIQDSGILIDDADSITGVSAITCSGAATFNAGILLANDQDIKLGGSNDARIRYETADADAKILLATMDESDDSGNNIPLFIMAEETNALGNLGLFDTIVEAGIGALNNAGDAFVLLDAGDVNGTSHGLYFKPAADEDVNVLKIGVTGTPTLIWDESADKLASSVGLNIADDKIVTLGTTEDAAFTLNSAGLAADTVLAGVLIGTPDTTALAANSLIISNITADGDILIAANDGGASKQMLFLDGSTGVTHIGLPGVPTSATAAGDVYMSGKVEIDNTLYTHGEVQAGSTLKVLSAMILYSDISLWLGQGFENLLVHETADADANVVLLALAAGDGVDVPVFVIGDLSSPTILNANLGFFNGFTVPMVATVASDNAGYFAFGCGDDDILNIKATTSPVVETDEAKFSHKLQCDINGSTYYIMLTTS